jgi:predicted phosphodiesterase
MRPSERRCRPADSRGGYSPSGRSIALGKRSGAALWVHGHTHNSCDYHIKRTRVLANPRGYVKDGKAENSEFDPGLTVEVGCVRQDQVKLAI